MSSSLPERSPAAAPFEAGRTLPWLIYLVFFAVLNETVFNVSTPAIAHQYGLTASGVSWVMTSFIVFFAMGSVIFGRLSDIFSIKSLILIGIFLYAGASAAGFALQSVYGGVIAARAVQGAGASALPALIMIIVARYFPEDQRGRVFGTITSVVAFAAGVGPVIGGVVSGSLGWPFLFAIPLLTLASIPFLLRLLPAEPRRSGGVDIPGAAFVAAGITALILFLSFSAWYWLAAAAAAVALLTLWITRVKDPFIDPRLFRNARFRAGMLAGFLVFSASIGIIFVIPLMFSGLRALSTRQIGLLMFPGAISGVVFGRLGGVMADRWGTRVVMALGLGLLVGSLLLLSCVVGLSPWFVSAALLLTYIGFTLIQTGLITSVSQTLPVQETGTGMGLFNLVTFISAAVGTALVARVLASGWFDFPANPVITEPAAWPYANLMVAFALLIAAGGAVYFARYRGRPSSGTVSAS
ncbi:MAG TPA: MFS transporter [Spirochaetia bacterium]|nr:MFS transporter [Spirochaetia bacterium]